MGQSAALYRGNPRSVLQAAVKSGTTGCLSYLSRGEWHSAKISLNGIGLNVLDVEMKTEMRGTSSRIEHNQEVSILINYKHMKIVFDTRVLWLLPSEHPTAGLAMVLAVPNEIRLLDRRRYARVSIPDDLQLNAKLWHLCHVKPNGDVPGEHQWKCKLVELSPGGALIAFRQKQYPDFQIDENVGLKFTPTHYEMPWVLSVKVTSVEQMPRNDHICLGLDFSQMETSCEGKQVLQRIYTLVEWHELNRCHSSQQSILATG